MWNFGCSILTDFISRMFELSTAFSCWVTDYYLFLALTIFRVYMIVLRKQKSKKKKKKISYKNEFIG